MSIRHTHGKPQKKRLTKPSQFFGDVLNLPESEEKVLEFWKTNHVFEASLKKNKGKKQFVFYEGPPYANGKPGIHHVLARSFKDIILRFKTMQGFFVPRRAGWDTHGLPTELAVEKELGIKSKRDIENFGIDVFNTKAKESVWRFKQEWEKLTKRMGYWLDLEHAYVTYTNDYIESLWWIFKRIHERGFLKEKYKVVPYCPRCQTPLAHHELGQPGVYKKTKDPGVYVKFRLKADEADVSRREYMVAWTTTPWTLPANLFLAVNPELTYTKYKVGSDFLWSATQLPMVKDEHDKPILAEAVEKMSGYKLVGHSYEPLYPYKKLKPSLNAYRVVPADFVSAKEGTGVVHIAPAFGEDDFNLVATLFGSDVDIPVTVDDRAVVVSGVPGAGKFIKEADADIIADLKRRHLLYHLEYIEHEYPFCWRCSTPLIYAARKAWFFEVSLLRQELLKRNETIHWQPSYIKEGRFGEWLKDARDWAISRERYWGAPLPIWRCSSCGAVDVVGSVSQLKKQASAKNTFFFVRHGEADNNKKHICTSHDSERLTPHLTPRGRTQVQKTAQLLKKKGVDIILSSPLTRTKETAHIIHEATGAKVLYRDDLLELALGVFDGRPVKERQKYFDSDFEKFTKTPPGGENYLHLKTRMLKAFAEINKQYEGKTIVIVSHGDPLWLLKGALAGLSDEEILKLPYPATGALYETDTTPLPLDREGHIDLHRPYIDELSLTCSSCGGGSHRVKDVADVWFDSGAMPMAQAHFPFTATDPFGNKWKTALKSLPFPADYICEAVDQTRGWFYTLLTISTLLDLPAPYKNVICLGLINDKFGQKMSKSKGNIVEPFEVMNKYGVDAVRWYFYTVNPPGEPKNFDEAEVAKASRRVLSIIYNCLVFYKTYAPTTAIVTKAPDSTHVLDRWILNRLQETHSMVTEQLEAYDVREAALTLEQCVDDFSRWYIRRSRRRLQKPERRADFLAASGTLGFVLGELAKLLAPFCPFFAEGMYRSLGAASSVHLADWSKTTKPQKVSHQLNIAMAKVRHLSSLGLAKRAQANIKVRQPLASLSIQSTLKLEKELLDILKDEVNVKTVLVDQALQEEVVLDTHLTPELKHEGIMRDVVRAVQDLRQEAALKQSDRVEVFVSASAGIVSALQTQEKIFLNEVNGKTVAYKKTAKFTAESETKLEGKNMWVAIKKI